MRAYRDRQRSLEQLSRHIEVWADELEAYELRERMQLGAFLASTPDGVTTRMNLGDAWANRHGTHTFLLEQAIVVPEGTDVELRLDFGGESLVRLIGLDGKILESFAANPCHRRFDVPRALPFKIKAESVARSLFGVPNRTPLLSMAEIYRYYPEIRALRRRLLIIRDTADTVKDKELARTLYEAAEIALSGLRLPTETQAVGPRLASRTWARDIWERSFEPTDTPPPLSPEALASVEAATIRLDALLAELRDTYPKRGRVLVTGHAHIDYAWLWPQPETVRKIIRTFNSVNVLLKRYDDFRFLQSSSLYYQHVEKEDPALFEDIKQRVSEGRWEIIGGMLVECDTNMPSAEAFLRQFLYGQRYFQKHFGITSRTAWLPDTFGFTAAMPQVMRHAGIDTLVTIKVSWNETNSLPDNLFRWQGNDGSRVLVHTFDAYENDGYNMLMTPAALCEVWGKHAAKDMTNTVIASYGWGDGGGGPDPDQIETLPLLNLMPAIPTVEHGAIEPHIQTLAKDLEAAALPVWRGELYLEYHRATLTTQARTKQLNRQAETALVAAEAISVLDELEGGAPAINNLKPQWELLLRNQFHDILPGSSIREVYKQTEPELEGVIDDATTLIQNRLQAIAARHSGHIDGLLIANLSGSRKTAFQIESESPLPSALKAQKLNGRYITAIERDLKPLSIGFVSAASWRRVTTDGKTMENDFVRLTLDDAGRMISLKDKKSDRELMDGPGNQLLLYRNDLPRNFDAWDIEPGFELGEEEWLSVETMEVTANGPHLAEITITRRFSASKIRQKIRLWSNSPRVEFVTDLDWHDRRTYLRAAFPVTVLAEDAVFDQAIGVTRRPTHDNTSWQKAQFESCGHRFVSLSETDWGAALLSADKYGFSAKGNRLTLSLVRGPMFPDMLADEGRHHFVYALLPHDGRWWSEETQAEADLINAGLHFTKTTAAENYDIAPIGFSGQNVRVHALKPAEHEKGHVLRLSETAGRRGAFHLMLPDGKKPIQINAIEVPLDAPDDPLSRPFGLASFLF
jgi:alpha-mannosidase